MNTIKRNRKVFEYFKEHVRRLNWNMDITDMFSQFIFSNLSVTDSKEVLSLVGDGINSTVLDNDALFIEVVKLIGVMEVSATENELRLLLERRSEIKYGEYLTDFDKILKAIMAVPNTKKKE